MAIDPTDPATYDNDGEGDEENGVPRGTPSADDLEAPEADSAEQHTELSPERDTRLSHYDLGSADEADAVEQGRVVPLDEDDYRP